MRPNQLKRDLRAGQICPGTWLSLGNLLSARYLTRVGFRWLTLDIEHGPWDWESACHAFALIAEAGCVPLARVPANRHEYIKRALDLGAHGVIVPMVNSAEEARAAVASAKYPPEGIRSVGGNVHALNFGTNAGQYLQHANDELLVILQCEHITAVEQADAIFSVPGIDAIFCGPNDLAWSMRQQPGVAPKAEAIFAAQNQILAACQRHRVPAGIHCFSAEEAARRAKEGWQFLAINSDLRFLLDGAVAALKPFRVGMTAEEAGQY